MRKLLPVGLFMPAEPSFELPHFDLGFVLRCAVSPRMQCQCAKRDTFNVTAVVYVARRRQASRLAKKEEEEKNL